MANTRRHSTDAQRNLFYKLNTVDQEIRREYSLKKDLALKLKVTSVKQRGNLFELEIEDNFYGSALFLYTPTWRSLCSSLGVKPEGVIVYGWKGEDGSYHNGVKLADTGRIKEDSIVSEYLPGWSSIDITDGDGEWNPPQLVFFSPAAYLKQTSNTAAKIEFTVSDANGAEKGIGRLKDTILKNMHSPSWRFKELALIPERDMDQENERLVAMSKEKNRLMLMKGLAGKVF